MSDDTWIIYTTVDLGSHYTTIIYFNSSHNIWKYRLYNVETGLSLESDIKLLTYEAALNRAIETVISVYSKDIGYAAKNLYNNSYEVKILFTNTRTSEIVLELIARTTYHPYKDNLLVLRVLQALAEQA